MLKELRDHFLTQLALLIFQISHPFQTSFGIYQHLPKIFYLLLGRSKYPPKNINESYPLMTDKYLNH